jgi:hypothetical protein
MKTKSIYQMSLVFVVAYLFSSCGNEKHEHDEHGHDEHGHDEHAEHGHDDDDGHDHKNIVGPNGGRVLTEFEPHAEFFVTEDRKVKITFVDEELKPVAAKDQVITVFAGDRSDPTELSFTVTENVLVSDKELPSGDDFPVVVMIKSTADSDEVGAKFQCNLHDCPTCDYKEYACICDHEEEK